ncbi:hypothetical protein F5878DRAFT_646373 [Lentinula raphanica]|uniref:Uncharacterized protein n=1 Tax=Lentinula raphanica TaxID=153919 RepID=A0AA38U668_9AGAR|nr:hypothetical protein F5878DRAFT_646373 [Lentinula raphanica]
MLTGPEPEQVIENEENDRWLASSAGSILTADVAIENGDEHTREKQQDKGEMKRSLEDTYNYDYTYAYHYSMLERDDEDEEAHPIRIVTRTLYIRKRKSRERNLLHLSDHRSLPPTLPISLFENEAYTGSKQQLQHPSFPRFSRQSPQFQGGTVCKGGILGVEKTKRREENGLSHEDEQNYHASFPPLDSDSDDDDKACDSEDNEEEGEGVAEDGGEGPLPVVTSSLRGGGGAGNPNINAYTPTSGSWSPSAKPSHYLRDLLTMRHTERCRIYPEGEGGVRGSVWVWVWMGDGEIDVQVDIDDDNGNVPMILDNVADRGGTTDKGKAVNETRPPPPFCYQLLNLHTFESPRFRSCNQQLATCAFHAFSGAASLVLIRMIFGLADRDKGEKGRGLRLGRGGEFGVTGMRR